jgi:hypothetical protein
MKKCLFILMVFTIAFSSKTIALVKTATINSATATNWSALTWTTLIVGTPTTTSAPTSLDEAVIVFNTGSTSGDLTINVPINVLTLTIKNNILTAVVNRALVAQVKTTTAITIGGDFEIGENIDFTLGTIGNTTCPVSCSGNVNIKASILPTRPYNSGGLYCNANTVSANNFTLGDFAFLGLGDALGINGNILAPLNLPLTGNYIYNGIVNQETGFGLQNTVNDITIDNPTVVTIYSNQIVNGNNLLKQGTFDITSTTITYSGLGKILSNGGKMKAENGFLEMQGNEPATPQYLNSEFFVDRKVGTLVNANSTGISIAASATMPPVPPTPLIIVNSLKYGVVTGSTIWTNDNVTLQSNNLGTANFGNATGNLINGKVSIERHLTGVKAWRLLSTPITLAGSPSVKDSWQEGNNTSSTASPSTLISNGRGTRITGPATYINPVTGLVTNTVGMNTISLRGSMKRFNATPTGVPDDFIFVNNTNNAIAHDDGYFLFVRGDMGVGQGDAPNATVLRMKGNLRTGDVILNSTNTVIGFQSIGNPYASRIEFSKVSKTNIVNAFHIWDPTLTGAFGLGDYKDYVWISTNPDDPNDPIQGYYQNLATSDIKNYIESGQAIYVQHNVLGASSVTIHESDKVDGSGPVSRPAPNRVTLPTLWIKMAKGDVDNTNPIPNTSIDANATTYYADGLIVNFNNVYRLGVNNEDVRKASKLKDNLAVKRDNYLLVADRRPSLQSLDTVYLNIAAMTVSTFRFDIDAIALAAIYPDLLAKLKDNYTGTETTLRVDGTTQYIFKVNADAASKAANRFMIVFRNPNAGSGISVGGRSAVTNTTATSLVQPIFSNSTAASSPSVPSNIEDAVTDEKLESSKPLVAIYPNVITNGVVNLRLQNQPTGTYQLQVSNQLGQVIKAESIQVRTSNVSHTINIGNAVAGSYQVFIVDKAGNKTTVGFMVN